MAPLYKPSHIEWFSSSLRVKKEQILERQKKFTGNEKNGGKIMGINQFLDTEFLLPHTPSINIVCNSPCAPLILRIHGVQALRLYRDLNMNTMYS